MEKNLDFANLLENLQILNDMDGFLDENKVLFDKLKLVNALQNVDARLIGAIMLDSFFYLLYEFIDNSLCFKPDKTFKDNPIYRLSYIGTVLELNKNLPQDVHYPNDYRKYNVLGNPFQRKDDCAKLLQIDAEKYYNTDIEPEYISTVMADFNRRRGFPKLINSISSFLSVIAEHINGKSEGDNINGASEDIIIRSLFLLYCLEKEFGILSIYFIDSKEKVSGINFAYEELFRNRYLNTNNDGLYDNLLPPISLCKMIVPYMHHLFTQESDIHVPVLSILDSMKELPFIKEFIRNKSFFDDFKSFSVEYKKVDKYKHACDLLSYFFPEEEWEKILDGDNNAYKSFMKRKKVHGALRRLSFYGIGDDAFALINTPTLLKDSNIPPRTPLFDCPLKIYVDSSLEEAYSVIAELEMDIANLYVGIAQDKIKLNNYEEFEEELFFFLRPFHDYIATSFLSLEQSDIVNIYKELMLIGNDDAKIQAFIEQYSGTDIPKDKLKTYIDCFKTMIENLSSFVSTIKKQDNGPLRPYLFLKITGVIDIEENFVEKNSRYLDKMAVVNCLIKYKYNYLLNKIDKKPFKEICNRSYKNNKRLDGVIMDIQKRMPCILKFTNREWKRFFEDFCDMLCKINKNEVDCFASMIKNFRCGNNRKRPACRGLFFDYYRAVYMQDIANIISEYEL